jgi:phosphatidylserine decarboxylase
VRQISGAIARRIICPLTVDTTVRRGGLIGMIKYGSRTELYLQDPGATDSAGTARERAGERASEDGSWEVAVRIGQHVRGGKTVIFRRRTSGGVEQGPRC